MHWNTENSITKAMLYNCYYRMGGGVLYNVLYYMYLWRKQLHFLGNFCLVQATALSVFLNLLTFKQYFMTSVWNNTSCHFVGYLPQLKTGRWWRAKVSPLQRLHPQPRRECKVYSISHTVIQRAVPVRSCPHLRGMLVLEFFLSFVSSHNVFIW